MEYDFPTLAADLLARSESLCAEWFPAGKKRGHEYLIGDLHGSEGDSLSINLNTGKWGDFATGEAGGDLISLYAAMNGVDQGEAYRRLTNGSAPACLARPAERRATTSPASPDIITPVPANASAPNMRHQRHGKPTATWAYRDQDGALLGYVARYDPPGERKQIVPWVFSSTGWIAKQFPEPRPLYGLDRLQPNMPVLVVEGEKSADAAHAIVGHRYAVLTWPGGAQAFSKADFAPIEGRKVLLWPDADAPGVAVMRKLADRLLDVCPEVKMLDPDGMPDGWDAADSGFDWLGFVAWAKPRARLVSPAAPDPEPARTIAAPPPPPAAPPDTRSGLVDYIAPLGDVNDKGRPLATIENVAEICQRLGIVVRYNVISKEEELLIPGAGFSLDNRQNASLAYLLSECAKFRMPVDRVPDFITYLADCNQFNPVANWILSKPWDGEDRLAQLVGTITAAGERLVPAIGELKRAMLTRWMTSAVAAVFRPNGVSAHGVLVFQGDQYIGKTKWFKSLVPAELGVLQDGVILRPEDRDSVKQCVSNWLVELGELDATFRKSDIAALKSFLTKDKDVLRRAYARKESEFARRTVFFASVNPKEFLHDPTGNRRYWTIECEALDYDHDIDMQQCWSQVYEQHYKAGASWFLLPEEMDLLNEHNKGFEVIDPIEEIITNGLDWASPDTIWDWKSATQVLTDLGRDTPTQAEATRAAHVIRAKNGRRSRKANGTRALLVPRKK